MTAAATIAVDAALPDRFRDVDHLEEVMTAPSAALVADMAKLSGDLLILGVGGKIGPTLARLAKRAAPNKRVVGIARFSEVGLRDKLTGWGVECIEADLLDRAQVEKLPKLPNVVFMAGRKFGSAGAEDLTWAMNAHVPALVAEAYAGSHIVAYSSGCVYPYVDVKQGGASETTPAVPPSGIYAYSCVAREAMFQHFSRRAWHAGPYHPPQLRDRHALRRIVRHRGAGAHRRPDQSDDGPRQRDLAGRRQRIRLARAQSLHCAVEPAQRQRPADQCPLARRPVRPALRQQARPQGHGGTRRLVDQRLRNRSGCSDNLTYRWHA